jgi:hypothetical protein
MKEVDGEKQLEFIMKTELKLGANMPVTRAHPNFQNCGKWNDWIHIRGQEVPEDDDVDCDKNSETKSETKSESAAIVVPAKIFGFVKVKTGASECMKLLIHLCKYRSDKDKRDDEAKGYIIFETWRMDTGLFLVDVNDIDLRIPNVLAVELEAEHKILVMKD